MSGDDNIGGQSAQSLLLRELDKFCGSDSLSEEGLCQKIERHGLTPNNDYAGGDYEFFLWACRNRKVDEGIIRCLLEYFTAAARATNEDRKTPLHYACANPNVTLNIIELLIDAAPDSVRSVDDDYQMPLHHLCENHQVDNRTSSDILKLLIEKSPESVRQADGIGELPIHIACACVSKSHEFCQVLIEAYPGSERITDAYSLKLPLQWACEFNTVGTVDCLYKLYPDAINYADPYGRYPIHCAITGLSKRTNPYDAIDTVQYLLDCDFNVKLQRWQGASLLQYSCRWEHTSYSNIEAALEMIKTIYDAHPEAIEDDRFTTDFRRSHDQVQAFINSELVYARQAKDHHLMTTPDDNGQLPLHRELQNNARLGSIKLLVKGNPHALESPDSGGTLPLHIACQHHDCVRVVKYLIGLDMATLGTVDREGNTAIHYACRGAKYQTIAMLLDEFDAVSVSKRNAQKKLPIDLLWESNAVEDRDSVEYTKCVFRLLKAYPETEVLSESDFRRDSLVISKKRKFGHE